MGWWAWRTRITRQGAQTLHSPQPTSTTSMPALGRPALQALRAEAKHTRCAPDAAAAPAPTFSADSCSASITRTTSSMLRPTEAG